MIRCVQYDYRGTSISTLWTIKTNGWWMCCFLNQTHNINIQNNKTSSKSGARGVTGSSRWSRLEVPFENFSVESFCLISSHLERVKPRGFLKAIITHLWALYYSSYTYYSFSFYFRFLFSYTTPSFGFIGFVVLRAS